MGRVRGLSVLVRRLTLVVHIITLPTGTDVPGEGSLPRLAQRRVKIGAPRLALTLVEAAACLGVSRPFFANTSFPSFASYAAARSC